MVVPLYVDFIGGTTGMKSITASLYVYGEQCTTVLV